MEIDLSNIQLSGKHLIQLSDYDNLSRPLSKEITKIIETHYNKGTMASLAEIKRNMSYGNFIVKYWDRFSSLMT